jgi:GDPmannose 4,6-dehydratase
VNGLGVARILEAIRLVDKNIKLCQASSSEIFGDAVECPQTEETKFSPRSPYGAAKVYADSMIKIYRQKYGIFACSAILYNHESPRRGSGFVTRKITQEAVKIKLGLVNELYLGNLDSFRDWGFADDYVNAMYLMMQHSFADDYIIATGELHSVREFCEYAFSYLGLNYLDYVKIDPEFFRPSESVQLTGNSFKARKVLGWEPTIEFKDLVQMIVDKDLEIYNQ